MRFKKHTNHYFLSLKAGLSWIFFYTLCSQTSSSIRILKKASLNSGSVHRRSSDPCRVRIHLLGLTGLEGSRIKGQWPQGIWGAALACQSDQSDLSRVMAPGRDGLCVLVLSSSLKWCNFGVSSWSMRFRSAWPQMNCFTTASLWCPPAAIK